MDVAGARGSGSPGFGRTVVPAQVAKDGKGHNHTTIRTLTLATQRPGERVHNNQRGVPDAMPARHHSFRPSCSTRSCPAQCLDGARSEGILADYDAKLLFACFVQVYPTAPSRRRHTWCTRRSRNIPDQLLASHTATRTVW